MASWGSYDNEQYRAPLERMLSAIDRGAEGEFNRELDTLTSLREQNLFVEIGKLTRQLHDSLNAFQVDQRIGSFAQKDMPDARIRLNNVIEMTEKAAHRSLGLIENEMPECDMLKTKTQQMSKRLQHVDTPELKQFLEFCDGVAKRWHGNLSELVMAQDYQDLTGQVIRDVIELVERVEAALVDLVRLSGREFGTFRAGNTVERVNGQAQVDDLLSSLGF